MWNRKELKAKGKAAFRANYWRAVLAALIAVLLMGGSASVVGDRAGKAGSEQAAEAASVEMNQSMEELEQALNEAPPEVVLAVVGIVLGVVLIAGVVVTLISAILFNPLKVGCDRFFLVNADAPATLPELLYGYKSNYGSMVKTLLLKDIYLWLWSLLFVIPGLVKSYSYRMVSFILAENPDIGAREAIRLSREMMQGQKWNAFMLDLSFIGWDILTIISFGLVGVLYAAPYQLATNAELYKAVRDLPKAESV